MKKILIVEDDEEYRNLLKQKLTAAGLAVHETKNGEEGLLELSKNSFDLILLDLIMPKMDGLKFYRQLKRTVKKKIPILILTNMLLSDIKELLKKPEIKGYIIKVDTNLDQLMKKVQAAIKT